MRVALYVRRSTDEKKQADSINAQLALLREFADREGHNVVDDTFRDNASGRTAKRSGFQRLIETVQGGPPFDAVLVRDVTRWGRFQNIDESAFWEFYFLAHRVSVIYVQESFGDPLDPAASIQKMLRRYAAAEFSREKSRLVQFGHFRSVQAGFSVGGRAPYAMVRVLTAPDGTPRQILKPGETKLSNQYRIKLAPGDEGEVRVVRAIFRWFGRDGLSMCGIVDRLNHRRIPSPNGASWRPSAIGWILRNPAYIGQARGRFRRSQNFDSPREVVFENAWLAIVDRTTWRKAQSRLETIRVRGSAQGLAGQLRALLREFGHSSSASDAEVFRRHFAGAPTALGSQTALVARQKVVAEFQKHFAVRKTGDQIVLNDLVTVGFKGAMPRGNRNGNVEWPFFLGPDERQEITIGMAFSPSMEVVRYFQISNVQFRSRKQVVIPRRRSPRRGTTLGRTLPEIVDWLKHHLIKYSSVARAKFFEAIKDQTVISTRAVARSLRWNESCGAVIYNRLKRDGYAVPALARAPGRKVTIVCGDCGSERTLALSQAMEHKTSFCVACWRYRQAKFATCPDCGETRRLRHGEISRLADGINSRCHSCSAMLACLQRDSKGQFKPRVRLGP